MKKIHILITPIWKKFWIFNFEYLIYNERSFLHLILLSLSSFLVIAKGFISIFFHNFPFFNIRLLHILKMNYFQWILRNFPKFTANYNYHSNHSIWNLINRNNFPSTLANDAKNFKNFTPNKNNNISINFFSH